MAAEFDVETILARLSMPNKIKLLTGKGLWQTEPIPEEGVPSIRFSDGPNGVRGTQFFNGFPSSCFPASTGLGSSFDIELAQKVGAAIGDEAHAKGCHVLLAPTVNTQRSPQGGRSFESFSEDPHLNGTIAAAYINGVQSKGVSATIKHYVANDQEHQRFSIDSVVSERALREVYLKPFQIAIKHSNPWALMTAYNRVNGIHASENVKILRDILRKEWGYQGTIISDWTGVYSTTESIKAGLDLEMPGPSVMRGKAIERVLIAEKLFPSDIDACARKVLELVKRGIDSGIPFDAPQEFVDTPELRHLLRTAAADATVLLKNDKSLLPLRQGIKNIAVIGPNAKPAMICGGGSAQTTPTYTVSPLQGIAAAAQALGAEVNYAIGAATHKYLPLLDPYISQADGKAGALVEFWNEAPSEDFISVSPNFGALLKSVTWSTPTLSTNSWLMDGIDPKVNLTCWIRYTTKFTPDEDGDWDFGMNLTGRGNLFINNELVIDLSTNPEPGTAFFGLATADVRKVVKGLKAGREYNLELRMCNEDFHARGSPFTFWGVVRVGGSRVFTEEEGINEAVEMAKTSDAAIIVVGLSYDWEVEGFDRPDLELPGLSNRLVAEVLKANPNTIVVNQSGAPVTMPWVNEASTLIQAFYGGNELGNGLADVIFGKVNPSGKLALTFPKCLEDVPSFPSFGDQGQEHGKIVYNEGIFVGYKGFEIRKLAPLFPFGYGLSYSKFEYSNLEISPISSDGSFTVIVNVKNISDVDGREIVQLYMSDQKSSLPRPVKELKGFNKVALKAGEIKTAKFSLDREALGFYDDRSAQWIAEKGIFDVHVGASSIDIKLKGEVELKESFTWTGL